MESFYSLQGEGYHTGKPAYFIRFAGCDVGCVWCDVKDSWNEAAHPKVGLNDLLQAVLNSGTENVVITGGEPAMYDLTLLTSELKQHDINVWLETSGAYEIKGTFDWICVSPKKFKKPLVSALAMANELKVVVFNKTDIKWAQENALHTNNSCKWYLQPEWSKATTMNPLIINHLKENKRWQLSLQTHKFLDIP